MAAEAILEVMAGMARFVGRCLVELFVEYLMHGGDTGRRPPPRSGVKVFPEPGRSNRSGRKR